MWPTDKFPHFDKYMLIKGRQGNEYVCLVKTLLSKYAIVFLCNSAFMVDR